MQIINESDMAVTWWCYDSNDTVREVTVDWGRGRAIWHREGGSHITRRTTTRVGTTCNSRGKTVIFLTFGGRPQTNTLTHAARAYVGTKR
jgi:hypothetical protein